jgi:site-specific recombinase XerD
MRLGDLNSEYDVVRVLGKGGRERALQFGRKTALALDRYLRARSRHRLAHLNALWLSQCGPLTVSGLRDLLDRRARQAVIPDLHPHMFRQEVDGSNHLTLDEDLVPPGLIVPEGVADPSLV